MEVILKAPVKGVGKPGEIVKVSLGYARNYLLPKKLAVEATPANKKQLAQKAQNKEQKEARNEQKRSELAETIAATSCVVKKQVSDDDKIFGSVTAVEICKCLKEKGIKLEKKQVILDNPIKSLGIHPVKIKLGKGTETVLKVWVEKQEG